MPNLRIGRREDATEARGATPGKQNLLRADLRLDSIVWRVRKGTQKFRLNVTMRVHQK